MQIDLSELFVSDGISRDYRVPISASEFSFGKEIYPLANSEEVQLHVVHAGHRQFQVTGAAKLTLIMPCARCMEDVQVPFELQLDVALNLDRPKEETAADEQYYVCGYCLDVDLLVFDELSLNIPISVVCKESCKGLCPVCGQNQNHGSCTCDRVVLDPRMARIADIFKNIKEV